MGKSPRPTFVEAKMLGDTKPFHRGTSGYPVCFIDTFLLASRWVGQGKAAKKYPRGGLFYAAENSSKSRLGECGASQRITGLVLLCHFDLAIYCFILFGVRNEVKLVTADLQDVRFMRLKTPHLRS